MGNGGHSNLPQDSYDVLSGLYDNGEADSDNVSYEPHSSHGKTKTRSHATVARRHTTVTVDPDEMAVSQDNEDAMPPIDEWSEYILFGTQASD